LHDYSRRRSAGCDAALERLEPAFRLGLATSASLPVAQSVLATTGWNRFFDVSNLSSGGVV